MIKNILTIPDKRLRQISREITNFDKYLDALIQDLAETLEAQIDPPGLGLSAPQIGVFKKVFVARAKNKIKAFINPKVTKVSQKEVNFLEGCFSVPELYGHVLRPSEIDLESQDRLGKVLQKHYKGLIARIIQHEIDHLNGVLFIDHVHNQNGKLFRVEKDKKGKEKLIEITYA